MTRKKPNLIEEVTTKTWITIFVIWLALIIAWNFGYPTATPAEDVIAAVIFSIFSTLAHEKLSRVIS